MAADAPADDQAFRLRAELVRLSLFEGFDELLCLPALQGVEAHWYQIETVRKVLKQYRGRVLLADEVGLGKTVEAGMVLKEYMLRGMAERVLILTPASLVGQWRDEMAAKFGIECATSHDPLLRSDPQRFWGQPLVIASIAAARRKEHAELLAGLTYDVVVVDEAHHLRDQTSASYRLVNALQKRFLLLLSATPVQNSLLELYNLLTLLQPGIFKTQKEFRSVYMVPGNPREPANRERLRDLMRGAMIRNTRALAAIRMPRRQAATLRAVPNEAEASCYEELAALVREAASGAASADGANAPHRLSLQHLLAAAGSSPAACAGAIARFVERTSDDPRWSALLTRMRSLAAGAKETALLRLLAQNPTEKKLVFVHHRDSLTYLAERLRRAEAALRAIFRRHVGPAEGRCGAGIPRPECRCSSARSPAARDAICNSATRSSTSTSRGIRWRSSSAWGASTASAKPARCSSSTWSPRARSRMRCCASSTTRSTCSSWWWARSARSWARSTSSRSFPRWCWTLGCKAPSRGASKPLPRWRASCWPRASATRTSSNSTRRCSETSSMPLDLGAPQPAPHEQGRMQASPPPCCGTRARWSNRSSPRAWRCSPHQQCSKPCGWTRCVGLAFGPSQLPSARRVGIEADWLDRFGGLLGEQGR